MPRVSPSISEFQDKLLTAYCYLNGIEKATLVKMGVNQILNPLDEKTRTDLLRVYENLTPEQRKNPEK